MAKYQTRPTTVEATQWFKPGDHDKVVEVIAHNRGVAVSEFEKDSWRGVGTVKYAILVNRFPHIVLPNDWIVKVPGESNLKVMTNSEFRRLYELVK